MPTTSLLILAQTALPTLSLPRLALGLLPAIAVLLVLRAWHLDARNALYGLARMLVQLLLIGYVLISLFETQSPLPVFGVLLVMIGASSWIALRNQDRPVAELLPRALLAIGVGGGIALATVVFAVLDLEPWFQPRTVISLAGMIFAAAMNSVSLAGERLGSEMSRGEPYVGARRIAMRAALIPITNSLFAVGLVQLPGMMTGQILAGADPLLAARYQIMVMCMLFGAAGISAALFLALLAPPPEVEPAEIGAS
ncbi:MAG: ABC transporter permease [Planctomycetota bacterium]|nr:ABC transporter permease [Planctomycetota bacterium]